MATFQNHKVPSYLAQRILHINNFWNFKPSRGSPPKGHLSITSVPRLTQGAPPSNECSEWQLVCSGISLPPFSRGSPSFSSPLKPPPLDSKMFFRSPKTIFTNNYSATFDAFNFFLVPAYFLLYTPLTPRYLGFFFNNVFVF